MMMRVFSFLFFLLTATGCASTVTHTDVGAVAVVTVRRSYNNVHAVRTPGGTVLIDAGLERDQAALADDLRAAGIDPAELALILLSHGHADHSGGAGWLRDTFGVPVLAGAGDLDLLESGHNDTLCPTDRTAARRLDEAQAETYPPFTPDHLVSAPLDLATLGLRGTVIPVTGHTGGSLVLDMGDAVFVGDLLRGSIAGHDATQHFYQCDPRQAVADVRALLDTSPASTWFVGHFGPLSRESVQTFVEEEGGGG